MFHPVVVTECFVLMLCNQNIQIVLIALITDVGRYVIPD